MFFVAVAAGVAGLYLALVVLWMVIAVRLRDEVEGAASSTSTRSPW